MRDITKKLLVTNTDEKRRKNTESQHDGSTTKYIGFGGGNLGNYYLHKAVWDSVFEKRTDSSGIEYIFSKLPVVTQYGITMYAGNNVDIPSIYEGIPVDGTTITKDKDGNLTINPNIDLGGGLDKDELENYLTTNDYAKKSDIPSLEGYATQSWVINQGYASSFSLASLQNKVNDFLEGSDTDTIINKWLELETFLSGLSESDNLATILSGKANSSDLTNYIPIKDYTEILGEKNFVGGLKVNGSPITYNSTGKYWKLEGDLLVTGNVTMYGNDSDFVASTIMDAIVADNTNLKVVDGVLTFVGSTGGASTLGELSNVGSWANSVASQDRIMYQAANSSMWVAKNLSDLAVGGVTGDYLPLTGGRINGQGDNGVTPLSVNSNIINYVGITMLCNNTESIVVGYWDSLKGLRLENTRNGLNNGISVQDDGSVVFYHADNNNFTKYPILHSGNYSSYALPLSGGTLTLASYENLVITRNADDAFSGLTFSNRNEGVLGYIGIGGQNSEYSHQPCFLDASKTVHKIWHAGNDGSGSGLDADLLDGVHGSSYFTGVYDDTIDFNKFADGSYDNHFYYVHATLSQSNRPPISYGGLLNLGVDTMNAQIAMGSDSKLWFRQRWWSGNGGNWSAWKQIAFTDSNVASATNADMLDGLHELEFFRYRATTNSFDTVLQNGSYRTTAFTPNNAYGYGIAAVFRAGETCAQLYFPDWSGEPRYRMGWNAQTSMSAYSWVNLITSNSIGSYNAGSATKLHTARTIWGQSFDGTGNVNGILEINEGSNSNSRATIALQTTSNNPCDLYLGSNNSLRWSITTRHSDQNYALGVYNMANGGWPLWINYNTNNVGIGTTSPLQKLHVMGNIAVNDNLLFRSGALGNITTPLSATSSIISWLANDGNKLGYVGYYSDHFIICNYKDSVECSGFSFYNNGDIVAFDNCNLLVNGAIRARDSFRGNYSDSSKQYLSLHSNGNAYINTPSEIYLQASTTVQGNLLATGGITMYSDIRKKTKLQDVELSLRQIANAPLIEHYYNSDDKRTTHVGSIAQYWAGLNDWFCKLDNEGYYTMEIQNAALASAISIARELDRYENKTDKKIKQLKKRISQLEDEIERLKNNIN